MNKYVESIPLIYPDCQTNKCKDVLAGITDAMMECLGEDYEIDDIITNPDEEDITLQNHIFKIHPKNKSRGFLFEIVTPNSGGTTVKVSLYNNTSNSIDAIVTALAANGIVSVNGNAWPANAYLHHTYNENGDHIFGITLQGLSIFYNFGFITTTDGDIHTIYRNNADARIVYSDNDPSFVISITRLNPINSMTQISKMYCTMTGQQYNDLWRIDSCPEVLNNNSFLRYNNLLFHILGIIQNANYQTQYAMLLQVPTSE